MITQQNTIFLTSGRGLFAENSRYYTVYSVLKQTDYRLPLHDIPLYLLSKRFAQGFLSLSLFSKSQCLTTQILRNVRNNCTLQEY